MLTLVGSDTLTDCPGCGGGDFARASLFSASGLGRERMTDFGASTARAASGQSYARTGPLLARRGAAGARGGSGTAHDASPARASDAALRRPGGEDTLGAGLGGILAQPEPVDSEAWLENVRAKLSEPGEYLAYEVGSELRTVPLTREWTRIGRSLAADVRFDDPTVSRRHALIVRQADGAHVLDDRSLNGVFVNGLRIDGSGIAQRALRDGDEIVVGRYRLRFLSLSA